ncbi:MAG: N-acetylglucosamine-6-phosphate deacetylase [Rhodospirillaceae bacterium]|nr:N-acetylglucosamine-6-phosphate deacetylase [Rhodospirillaceae bacterium]
MAVALTGARVFDGERIIDGHAVIVEGDRIAALTRDRAFVSAVPARRIEGILAPGFIDVQVNGGGGALFNDAPTVDCIRTIGLAHRRFGTTGFLPTLITDTRQKMAAAVAAVLEAMAGGVPGVLGLHFEGPFLNPERRGVHDAALIRSPEEADLALMTGLEAGRTVVTLAPERVPPAVVARLAGAGVLVCAGHTAADHAMVRAALAAGLAGFTHLFNAMPPLAARAPGPVGAALEDGTSFIGLIADLVHVAAPVLRVAIAAKGHGRVMLVTDAMPTVGSAADRFTLQGQEVTRRDGRLTTADGTLAGSDLDMATAVRNLVQRVGVPLEQALAMASRVPASFLRLDGELGRIAPGWRANLVRLDDSLAVRETWIDGVSDIETR